MENPFLNLHPKIYYRKKNALGSGKMNIVKNKEVETDLKSSALLRSNNKRDLQTRLVVSPSLIRVKENLDVGWETRRTFQQSSPKRNQLNVGKSSNSETTLNGQDELAYLNQRNISFSKYISSGETKFSFPLIALPRNLSRESGESVKSSFTPSHRSHQDVLPRIRYGSFISVVYEEEKKKRKKMHKRGRETQKGKREPQETSLLNALESACFPCTTASEIQVDSRLALQQDCTGDFRGYRSFFKSAVTATEDDYKEGNSEITRNNADSQKTCSECNYHGESTNSDFMVLKAKLHRSSFT